MIVVIPSNRSIDLDHLAPLIDAGARFVIVDDTEGSIQNDRAQARRAWRRPAESGSSP